MIAVDLWNIVLEWFTVKPQRIFRGFDCSLTKA